MMKDFEWSGTSMQQELLHCKIARETRVTDAGAGELYYLSLGGKLIPLGISEHWAKLFQFALQRNAEAFEAPRSPQVTESPHD
jgi:hypothetical protein